MSPPTRPDDGPDDVLDPTALARFGRLELLARLAVEGMNAGSHRSPFKGSSVEFAEHRQYGPGDEIRRVDWRAYGKSDRYFVKEYEEETNLNAYLVVDSSASMAYTGAGSTKLEHARRLAATVAYLMLKQRDAVGLVAFGASTGEPIPARSAPGHFAVLCRALELAEAAGETPPSAALNELAGRVDRRGLVVVLSDAFEPLPDLIEALRHLRHRRHEVLLLHVLAPEEEEFPFRGPTRLRPLERPGDARDVDPAAMRAAYLGRFRAFCRDLEGAALALGCDYHRASTAEPPGRTLLDYLAARSARKGRRGAAAEGGR
jgi:uncharacterized protein (DUF58 family)